MSKRKLLIVDDEENMRHMLEAMLKRHSYNISLAADGVAASDMINHGHFDFILCDVRMPGMDGLEFISKNKKLLDNSTVIMMSAYGSVDIALEAMKVGAYDFISKPFKTDEVLLALKKAEEREQLKNENRHLKNELQKHNLNTGFENVIGDNKGLKSVVDLAKKVAQYDTTVLITGESGTGKELIARGIHTNSPRERKLFYAINCGSIPGDLLESELFGYMKGSFTGADNNKKGLFEAAHGSTLFLDEIGELPISMQVKLLRVLQEKEIRPVGSNEVKKVDVRIIAATANNLEENVVLGKFREDLYYRLNVVSITLPPLHLRIVDIPNLCSHFIRKYNENMGCSVKGVSSSAMKSLLRYSWPGNVRELENVIQHGMVLTDSDLIDIMHLPQSLVERSDNEADNGFNYLGFSLKDAQKQLERKMIKKALTETGGNKSKAAILLDISYPSLLNKIKEYC